MSRLLAFLLLPSLAAAEGFLDRAQRAGEAEPVRWERALARLRVTSQGLSDLARRQPGLHLTPEGEAFHVCAIPSDAAVGSDNAAFVQTAQYPAAQTFRLHSRPGARRVIYLDFDGHVTPAGGPWGGRIVTPAYDTDGNPAAFSGAERGAVQQIWRQVAEDFAPFDVDVTTEEPGEGELGYSGPGDNLWGMRVAIGGTSTDWYKGGAGGVAFVGSFRRATEVPCFVFSGSLFGFNSVAYAASHEVGHTFGLSHDGADGVEYYGGHGDWAPIMGAGYGKPVVQWSKGEYAGANNAEDDLAIIAEEAPLVAPDIGPARELALGLARGDVAGGTIRADEDAAWYRLLMSDGPAEFVGDVAAPSPVPNLKLQLTLLDEAGEVVAQSAPGPAMGARLRAQVRRGTHFLVVEGVGAGDPSVSFGGYGSVGRFRVSGTWSTNVLPVASTAGSSPLVGKAPLPVRFAADRSHDPDGVIRSWRWDFGDGSFSEEAAPTKVFATAGDRRVTLTVTDDLGGTASAVVDVRATAKSAANRPMRVGAATGSWEAGPWGEGRFRATFRMLDAGGRPLPGVTVVASLSGLDSGVQTGLTDRAGNVVFRSVLLPSTSRGSVTFTVRHANLVGNSYLPERDVRSSVTVRR